jgi:hypothetical protein
MKYDKLTETIEAVAKATIPKGTYFLGRKAEANFEYDKPFPQIHMLPPVLQEPGGSSDAATWNCTFIFYFLDEMANDAERRSKIISEGYKLRSFFKNNLQAKPHFLMATNVTTSPTMLQLMAKASGVIMTVNLAGKDEYSGQCGFIGEYNLPCELEKC